MREEQNDAIMDALASNLRKDLIQFQLDFSDKLEEIEYRLRGYRRKNEVQQNDRGEPYISSTWEKITDVPLMNDKGILYTLSLLDSLINKNTFMSKIGKQFIEKLTRQIHMELLIHFNMNALEFGIDPEKIKSIVWLITPEIYIALKRAQDGGERESLTTIRRVIESIAPAQTETKKRLPSIFGGGQP